MAQGIRRKNKNLILILGGARSGKSSFAIELAKRKGSKVTYLATADAIDPEMKRRIARHRRRRPSSWETIEVKRGLKVMGDRRWDKALLALKEAGNNSDLVIFDCLGVFVSNLLENNNIPSEIVDWRREKEIERKIKELIKTIKKLKCPIIVVSNEVGQGVVPPYPSGRSFRDLLGLANQMIAQEADEVYWMVAGIAVKIKCLPKL